MVNVLTESLSTATVTPTIFLKFEQDAFTTCSCLKIPVQLERKKHILWHHLQRPPCIHKGKGNIERKYVYLNRTFQAEKFDTSLIKINK